MTTKKISTTSSDDRSQLDKFKDAARELECDDDEQRFRERLGKLVNKTPEPRGPGVKKTSKET